MSGIVCFVSFNDQQLFLISEYINMKQLRKITLIRQIKRKTITYENFLFTIRSTVLRKEEVFSYEGVFSTLTY